MTPVRSCWKRLPRPAEQISDGSEDGHEAGNTSVMTYVRTKSKHSHGVLLLVKKEVRTCEGNMETPRSVEKEGRRSSGCQSQESSAGRGETMVEQLCPCSPWGSTGDAEIHPQPMGIHRELRDPPTASGDPQGMKRSTHSLWGSTENEEIHPQPTVIHGGSEIRLQPMEEVPMPEQVDAWRRL
ncbi:hypothetical protein HGM15179_010686 [Zosterops borbonicus]|uniref:Uncharacterized protein n=1 Tax=Zosterops borbonicus TaxID=364589 RepID=A0A8K1GEV7_9PASS|nr:hypothetical protein HGM15179_010686 [Zosterops borbonicus]